jgi:hypothetical protein
LHLEDVNYLETIKREIKNSRNLPNIRNSGIKS